MDDKLIENKILNFQRSEITGYFIYKKLAEIVKDPKNKEILSNIAEYELKHFNIWKEYTHQEVKPNKLKILLYILIAKTFGITFAIKLMERGEDHDILSYKKFSEAFPVAKEIARDEEEHEKELTNLINEERLKYVSSIVLGLNDALIELTGALAGFTLAFVKVNYIVIAALITGISAALSMAVSEYLSTKMGEEHKSPLKASFYTGIPYILTVIILILPFLIIKNVYFALGFTVFNAILLIFLF